MSKGSQHGSSQATRVLFRSGGYAVDKFRHFADMIHEFSHGSYSKVLDKMS